MADTCIWTNADDECYETSCGQSFCMIDGKPSDNSMRFCCYCGKPLEEREPQTREEAEADAGDRAYHEAQEER